MGHSATQPWVTYSKGSVRSQHVTVPNAYFTAVGTSPFNGVKSTTIEVAEAFSNGSMVHPESKPSHAVVSGVLDVFCLIPVGPKVVIRMSHQDCNTHVSINGRGSLLHQLLGGEQGWSGAPPRPCY